MLPDCRTAHLFLAFHGSTRFQSKVVTEILGLHCTDFPHLKPPETFLSTQASSEELAPADVSSSRSHQENFILLFVMLSDLNLYP